MPSRASVDLSALLPRDGFLLAGTPINEAPGIAAGDIGDFNGDASVSVVFGDDRLLVDGSEAAAP